MTYQEERKTAKLNLMNLLTAIINIDETEEKRVALDFLVEAVWRTQGEDCDATEKALALGLLEQDRSDATRALIVYTPPKNNVVILGDRRP